MKNNFSEHIYKKLEIVSSQVKSQLEKKGIAIPIQNDNGSISIGHYTIIKRDNFYYILDFTGNILIDKINLPQTAIMLANNLALGKFLDNKMLDADRNYGYAEFEEVLHKRLAEKYFKRDINTADIMMVKSKIKRDKKEIFKRAITKSFEKLRNIA